MPETLARTSLGKLAAASRVNLEDALRAGEPFGGHLVQGHVDGVGDDLRDPRPRATATGSRSRVPADLLRYVAEKGSIAVAGISLTVAALRDDGFEVALIPHTWTSTTVSALEGGGSGQSRGRRDRQVRRATAALKRSLVA